MILCDISVAVLKLFIQNNKTADFKLSSVFDELNKRSRFIVEENENLKNINILVNSVSFNDFPMLMRSQGIQPLVADMIFWGNMETEYTAFEPDFRMVTLNGLHQMLKPVVHYSLLRYNQDVHMKLAQWLADYYRDFFNFNIDELKLLLDFYRGFLNVNEESRFSPSTEFFTQQSIRKALGDDRIKYNCSFLYWYLTRFLPFNMFYVYEIFNQHFIDSLASLIKQLPQKPSTIHEVASGPWGHLTDCLHRAGLTIDSTSDIDASREVTFRKVIQKSAEDVLEEAPDGSLLLACSPIKSLLPDLVDNAVKSNKKVIFLMFSWKLASGDSLNEKCDVIVLPEIVSEGRFSSTPSDSYLIRVLSQFDN